MKKIGFLFPGQGAQYVGMGEAFYLSSSQAKDLFHRASSILDKDFAKLCFQGSLEELTSTINCQLAIFLVSAVSLQCLKKRFPQLKPSFCAGLSLGEYTALYASGVLKFEDTLKLIERRASFMQEASFSSCGAMLSVIGEDLKEIESLIEESNSVEIANINSPSQIVLSGLRPEILELEKRLKDKGYRTVLLNVSGAFHSKFMESAKRKLKDYLEGLKFKRASYPLVCNVSAESTIDPLEIKENLILQMTQIVNWRGCCEFMINNGTFLFLEIGPGKILKGLMRRINSQVRVISIGEPGDIENLDLFPKQGLSRE